MESPQYWWAKDQTDVPSAIAEVIESLDGEQGYRTQANLRNLRLYSNMALIGLGAGEYASDQVSLPPNRLTLNVVECVVETAKALIGTNRPKIRALTEGGTRKQRKLAQSLTKFFSGQFRAGKLYKKAQQMFGDAAVFGTGFIKVSNKNNEICYERVFPDEILIDDVEGKYGTPRSLYQHAVIERSVLKKEYPEVADLLGTSSRMREQGAFMSGLADPVSLVEAWHLPSKEGAGDGVHVICTSNVELLKEEWKLDHFPFATFRYLDRQIGFWGKGIPEQLRGLQIEINLILQKVQRLMNLASSKVFVEKGSKVNKDKLDNSEWGIVEYVGRPPVFATVKAVSPEYYNQLDRLYAKAFEISGVSQLSAQSRMPPGMESGRAIMEYNDIQTQRFLHVGQRWEELFVELAELSIDQAKILSKKTNGKYSVLVEHEKGYLEKVKWSDADPGKNKYVLSLWPVSLLPDSPAGKLETVQALAQVDPRLQPYLTRLLNFPDIEAVLKKINAPSEVMDVIIEDILDGKRFVPPEPFMDLRLGITDMMYAYLEAVSQGVDEDTLAKMRNWMEQARALIEAQTPAPPAGLAMGEPAPSAPKSGQAVQLPSGGGLAPVEAMTGF